VAKYLVGHDTLRPDCSVELKTTTYLTENLMANQTYTSFANLAANGNTASVATPADVSNVGAFMGTGVTFGAGTLKAQVSFDAGTTWLDVPNASFTAGVANTKKQDQTVIGPLVRWNLAGATRPRWTSVRTRVKSARPSRAGSISLPMAASSLPSRSSASTWRSLRKARSAAAPRPSRSRPTAAPPGSCWRKQLTHKVGCFFLSPSSYL
jgi:hypothetical protein